MQKKKFVRKSSEFDSFIVFGQLECHVVKPLVSLFGPVITGQLPSAQPQPQIVSLSSQPVVNKTASKQPQQQQFLWCSLTNHCWLLRQSGPQIHGKLLDDNKHVSERDFCSLYSSFRCLDLSCFQMPATAGYRDSFLLHFFCKIKHTKQVSFFIGMNK